MFSLLSVVSFGCQEIREGIFAGDESRSGGGITWIFPGAERPKRLSDGGVDLMHVGLRDGWLANHVISECKVTLIGFAKIPGMAVLPM